MSAVEGAIAGWNAAGTSALVPRDDLPYGDAQARLLRYRVADSYINNTIYDTLNRYSTRLKTEERLYKFIRSIVNPVAQENNLIVSYTYRGAIDTATLRGGALPLVFDNAALEDALKQVIKWSNLDGQLGDYVHDAALYGDAAWWLVDDPARGRVRLELLDPARVKYVERDEVGNVRAAVIEYVCDEQPDVQRYIPSRWGSMRFQRAKTFVKTIKVTKEWFETFKDGEPFAFYADETGAPVSRWPNVYGFVPLKLAQYAKGRDGWGRNSFFGAPRRLIDELNDQASIVNDSIRNVVVPLLQAVNVRKSDDITIVREDKDSLAIAYLSGEGAELKPVTIPLDIAAASANRNQLTAELKKHMPILSLQDVRDRGDLSGVAIANLFGDAISVIENVRKALNPPLVAALQMAVTMGGIRRYPGFEAFNAGSFDAGDMELSVKETPVIDDQLPRGERVDKVISIAALPPGSKRKALEEIGYTDEDIETILADDAAQSQQPNANPTVTPDSLAKLTTVWDKLGMQELMTGMDTGASVPPPMLPNGQPQMQGATA